MKDVLSLIKEMIEKRRLIWELSKSDFRKRFVGSYFGVIWMFLQPLVTVLIYWFIFGEHGMRTTPPIPNAVYVVWLVPGLVPWFFYSEALNCMTGCLQEYSYLVKKVVFKVEILPIIKLMSCMMVHGFFMAIMFLLYFVYRQEIFLSWIQVVYYSFASAMLALGFGYLTCAVNVFFKDMTNIVGICLQFGIWMAPIMYVENIFTDKSPWAEMLLKLNPFYYIVAGYRDSMLTGAWFWQRPTMTIYYWCFTVGVLLVGLKVFKGLRPHFSDVL